MIHNYIHETMVVQMIKVWTLSTIIVIIRAYACWALFVATLTNTVHFIYVYIYIYIYCRKHSLKGWIYIYNILLKNVFYNYFTGGKYFICFMQNIYDNISIHAYYAYNLNTCFISSVMSSQRISFFKYFIIFITALYIFIPFLHAFHRTYHLPLSSYPLVA